MAPAVALHVTAALLVPDTLAVNCCVAPVCRAAAVGVKVTLMTGGGAVTVTVAEAVLAESATLLAVTV